MSKPIFEPTTQRQLGANDWGVSQLQRRPGGLSAHPWMKYSGSVTVPASSQAGIALGPPDDTEGGTVFNYPNAPGSYVRAEAANDGVYAVTIVAARASAGDLSPSSWFVNLDMLSVSHTFTLPTQSQVMYAPSGTNGVASVTGVAPLQTGDVILGEIRIDYAGGSQDFTFTVYAMRII